MEVKVMELKKEVKNRLCQDLVLAIADFLMQPREYYKKQFDKCVYKIEQDERWPKTKYDPRTGRNFGNKCHLLIRPQPYYHDGAMYMHRDIGNDKYDRVMLQLRLAVKKADKSLPNSVYKKSMRKVRRLISKN